MSGLTNFKDIENKVHEHLYTNIYLLTQIYPTTEKFNEVFKKDMFVKNNKAAFYEVVYYLLNILNPELTKETLTMWPPYEIRRENKFRSELLQYINRLNILYDNADIPVLMASHLISPGGLKFGKFMMKLSQLVVFEHLQKVDGVEKDLLYRIKPTKNSSITNACIQNVKTRSNMIEMEIQQIHNDFEAFCAKSKEQADKIVEEHIKLNEDVEQINEKFRQTREDFDKKFPSYPSIECLEKSITSLKEETKFIVKMQQLFKDCKSLMEYLNGNDMILEHDKSTLRIPDEISHIVSHRDELDIQQLFHGLNVLLERKALELPSPTHTFLQNKIQMLDNLIEKYSEIDSKISEKIDLVQDLIQDCHNKFKTLSNSLVPEIKITSCGSDETLAVPLDLSI